jgi:tetratricopeptide (TPR) repeat protein
MDSPVTGSGRLRVVGVRAGVVPPLADGFTTRPESVPGLAGTLLPGSVMVLANEAQGSAAPGKTQLAAFYAESLWRAGRVELLAWVDASSRAAILAGYLRAAVAAGIESAGPAEEMAARLAGWLAETARPWLLVLDDLRDPADLDRLWPHGPAGMVVITTWDKDTLGGGPQPPQAQVVEVGAFSTREALNYLMGRLTDDPDQRNGAIDLAIALSGDPCALTYAAAVIASSTQTCRDYQHHYTDRLARLAAHQANGTQVAPVAATWLLSADRAGQLAPGGATGLLLGLAALLDGQPVPAPVFTSSAVCQYLTGAGARATGPDRAWEAVRALAHTGLLAIDPAPSAGPVATPLVRISRATAALARSAMPPAVFERAVQVIADALVEIWPSQEPQPWQAANLRSCAARLQHTAGDRLWVDDAPHPLLLTTGHSLDTARLTGPAARHWAQVATASDKLLGPAHPATLDAGTHLARALLAAGNPNEAAAWWQWLAAGHARLSGPGHPSAITAQLNLGHALTAAGQPTDATTVLEQALAECERTRGPSHPEMLRARGELAAACQAAGKTAEAIRHYQRTVAEHERIHGPHHPATLTARGELAAACLAAGRVKEAISGYKKILTDRQRTLGTDHPGTIEAQRHLATAYHAAGKIAAALQQHDQACTGLERLVGTNHRQTLTCRADLANAYYAAGRLTDAATLLRDTLTRCEQALPPGDPLTQSLKQTLKDLAGG